MHTDAKMPHFPPLNGKIKWGIMASVCIFMQVTYLCHINFGAFWQPSCIYERDCSLSRKFSKIDIVGKCGLDFGTSKNRFFHSIDFAEFLVSRSAKAVIVHGPFLHIGHSSFCGLDRGDKIDNQFEFQKLFDLLIRNNFKSSKTNCTQINGTR